MVLFFRCTFFYVHVKGEASKYKSSSANCKSRKKTWALSKLAFVFPRKIFKLVNIFREHWLHYYGLIAVSVAAWIPQALGVPKNTDKYVLSCRTDGQTDKVIYRGRSRQNIIT